MPLLVDPEVLSHETVLFAGGLETESIRVRAGELFRDEPLTLRQLTRWNGRASEEPPHGGWPRQPVDTDPITAEARLAASEKGVAMAGQITLTDQEARALSSLLERASDRLATYEEQTHQDRRLAEEIREAAGDLVNRISRAGSTA